MEKLMRILCSIVESLTYMIVALLTAFAAGFMYREVSWQMAALLCIAVSLLMAYILYANKAYGFGFVDDEEEDDEEEGFILGDEDV